MPPPLIRCIACGRLYYQDVDECPDSPFSPHDLDTKNQILMYLMNAGWDPKTFIPPELHKEAIREIVVKRQKESELLLVPEHPRLGLLWNVLREGT